jgi:hypothetical protein
VIPGVAQAAQLALRASLGSLAQRAAAAEMRAFSRAEMRRFSDVTFELTGDRFVANRLARLENKVRTRISWNAMRDALNEYRNIARKAWRSAPVKRSRDGTRAAIARNYAIKRIDRDTLAVGVSYSRAKARKANLLEWDTRKTTGKLVGTTAFEDNERRLFRTIAESVRVQIYSDPDNAKARRQAVRARLGAV